MLEDHDEGMIWECLRSHRVETPGEDKVRYALLVGILADNDDEIIQVFSDKEPKYWLEDISVIHRADKKYVMDDDYGTFREDLGD